MKVGDLARPLGSVPELTALGVAAVALFLALFFSAQAGLLVLAAAWLAVGTWRMPWPAFLALVAVAPFLPILKATVVLGPITLLKDVVILTLFVRTLRDGGAPIPRPILMPVLTLVAWAVVAFATADARTLGLLRLRDLLLYVPMLLVALRLVATPERARTFLRVFLGTAALVLVLALVQRVFFPDGMVLRFDPVRNFWIPRAASVLAHPNILGGFLLFAVPLASALALSRGVALNVRRGAVLVFLGGIVAAYATYSRSAWIALVIALLGGAILAAAFHRPRLIGAVALAGLLVVLGGFLLPAGRTFLTSVVDPAYESNRTRLDIALGTLARVSDRGAILGEGLGAPAQLLGRTADISLYDIAAAGAREAQIAKARTFVDNAVAKTWIEQGVVGLVLAGWVAVRLFLAAARAARLGMRAESRSVGLAAASILLGLAALWLFLDVPDIFPVNLYFWTFAGLLATSPTQNSKLQTQN